VKEGKKTMVLSGIERYLGDVPGTKIKFGHFGSVAKCGGQVVGNGLPAI
jgi:hypothetical protein